MLTYTCNNFILLHKTIAIQMSDEYCVEVRNALTSSVQKNLSDAVLLSGGLDSSIITGIASKFVDLTGITITYKDAPDVAYAKIIAEKHSVTHLIKHLAEEEVSDAIENVIRIMETFDPMEIRNTSVIYVSLKEIKNNGFDSVMTGDGGDELFAGYNYMRRMDMSNLESELQRLWKTMRFSAIAIGDELGITVKTPYLDQEFIELAKRIPLNLKIMEQDGVKWGKWILRHCFEDYVTREVAWRAKMPLEEGAGISAFARRFDSSVMDDYFAERVKYYASHDSVRIRDKEHLYYYTIYRKFFDMPKSNECESRCPDCKGYVEKDSRFCRTCGSFPIKPI